MVNGEKHVTQQFKCPLLIERLLVYITGKAKYNITDVIFFNDTVVLYLSMLMQCCADHLMQMPERMNLLTGL